MPWVPRRLFCAIFLATAGCVSAGWPPAVAAQAAFKTDERTLESVSRENTPAFPGAPEPSPDAAEGPPQVVMLGDSLTHRYDWQASFPTLSVRNLGVGGDSTADVLRRIQGVLDLRPRRVFTMVGVNDSNGSTSVDEALGNYTHIIAALSEAGIEPVVLSTLFVAASSSGKAIKRNAWIAELDRRLEVLCGQRGVRYIDMNKRMSDAGSLRPDITVDGIHLNDQGYAIWVELIRPFL